MQLDLVVSSLTNSTREAARRIGVSDTAIHKAERAGRIANGTSTRRAA